MAAPYSTVGGYGSATVQADGSLLVDTEDGIPVVGPAFVLPGGGLQAAVISPIVPGNIGVPELNAVLIELRVITSLLLLQLGVQAPDVEQMRADELWNTTVGSGSI